MNSTSASSSISLDGSLNPSTTDRSQRRVDTSSDGHHHTKNGIHPRTDDNKSHYRGYQINDNLNHSNYSSSGEKRFRREDAEWNRRNNNNNNNSRRYRGSHEGDEQADNYYSSLNHINSGLSYDNRGNREWRCLECSAWNDDGTHECHRCRSNPKQRGVGSYQDDYDQNDYHHKSRNRGYSHDNSTNSEKGTMNQSGPSNPYATIGDHHPEMALDGTNESTVDGNSNATELDEFGRVKSRQPKKIRWPPCFESHGSAFVLDTRSGMFYESISDFFYDPKSKLYYGNKQGAYFQYDPTTRNFINVSENKPEPIDDKDNAHVDSLESSSTLQSTEMKKPSITINLKTKALASSTKAVKKSKKEDGAAKDKAGVVVPEPVTVPKQHAVNIEKWSERQMEIRQQENEDKSKCGGDDSTKIVATAKGEPICLLCRRRFPNLDKLRHHEEVSNLHKENLAKQTASTAAIKQDTLTVSSTTYVDRAEQRRQLHDVEKMNANSLHVLNSDLHSTVSLDTHPSRSNSVVETKNNASSSNSTLDESNIGHQMLQKLGWKSGNSLGKNTESSTTSTADDTIQLSELSTTTSRIEQDWDRIEAVAKLASSQRSTTMNIGKKGIGH